MAPRFVVRTRFTLVLASLLIAILLSGNFALAQSTTPAERDEQTLRSAAETTITAPSWKRSEDQITALLAGQAALSSTNTITGFHNSLIASTLLDLKGNPALIYEAKAAQWSRALLRALQPAMELEVRASLGRLATLSPSSLDDVLRPLTLSPSEGTLFRKELLARSDKVLGGSFTGDLASFKAAFPKLYLIALSDLARNPAVEIAKLDELFPSVKISQAKSDLVHAAILGDPETTLSLIPSAALTRDRLKMGAMLRAANLIYECTLDYDPNVGMVGGPAEKAYILSSVGVSPSDAIRYALMQAPRRTFSHIERSERELFSQFGTTFTEMLKEARRRTNGCAALTSFIYLYPTQRKDGSIGEVTSVNGPITFSSVSDLLAAGGALPRAIQAALSAPPPSSTPATTPSPGPATSPTPEIGPSIVGAIGAGTLIPSRFAFVATKIDVTTTTFRLPAAANGEGVVTVNAPPQGAIKVTNLVGLSKVDGSEAAILRAVLAPYPNRLVTMEAPRGSRTYNAIVTALQDNPLVTNLSDVPLVKARPGGLSLQMKAGSLVLTQTPGEARYWRDRGLLTNTVEGRTFLEKNGIVPDETTGMFQMPNAPPRASRTGARLQSSDPITSVYQKGVSPQAQSLAERHLSALISLQQAPVVGVEVALTDSERTTLDALKRSGPSNIANYPLWPSIKEKYALAIEQQFVRPLNAYIDDFRAGAPRDYPNLTPSQVEAKATEKMAAFFMSGDMNALFSASIEQMYRNIRLPLTPYAHNEADYLSAEKYALTDPSLGVYRSSSWIYRMMPGAPSAEIPQRASLNVSISPALLKELDALLLTKTISGMYKFGGRDTSRGETTAAGYRRHDAITIYLTSPLSDQGRQKLADLANRYGRGVHELTGEKIAEGASVSVNFSAPALSSMVQNLRKIHYGIGNLLEGYLLKNTNLDELKISDGQYEASKSVLARFGIVLASTPAGAMKVSPLNSIASADVMEQWQNHGASIVDRLAVEAFEEIERAIKDRSAPIPIPRENREVNNVFNEMLRRIDLDPQLSLTAQEVLDPTKLKSGSDKFEEYQAFKTEYEALQRKLLGIKERLYIADDARMNLIKGYLANSSNRIQVLNPYAPLEANANPDAGIIRIHEKLLQLDFLAHEIAHINQPREWHLFNLVRAYVGADGTLPAHMAPFHRALEEIISITAEFSGTISPEDITKRFSSRYARTMDTLVALQQSNPKLFQQSPETMRSDVLSARLESILLEQTTRPLADAVKQYRQGKTTGVDLQRAAAAFADKVGWISEISRSLKSMEPAELASVIEQGNMTGFNLMARGEHLEIRNNDAQRDFVASLARSTNATGMPVNPPDRVSLVNNAIQNGLTKPHDPTGKTGIPTNPNDKFWDDWKKNGFMKGYEFPIKGPVNDQTQWRTLKSSVEVPLNGNYDLKAHRGWRDSVTIQGQTYTGWMDLYLKVDGRGLIPPQYKLSFTADRGQMIDLNGGRYSSVVFARPANKLDTLNFTFGELIPHPNDIGGGGSYWDAVDAVKTGNHTQQQLDLIKAAHMRPTVVTEVLSRANPTAYYLGHTERREIALRDLLNSGTGVPSLAPSDVTAIEPQIKALQAARGVPVAGQIVSPVEAALKGNLVQNLGWTDASKTVLGTLSEEQITRIFSEDFSAFDRFARSGDILGMKAVASQGQNTAKPNDLADHLFGGKLLTHAPATGAIRGDLDLILKARKALLSSPEITKTERWAMETAFKEMARNGLTPAERTNLTRLVEHSAQGARIIVPGQAFGQAGALSAREAVARIAYLNWAGGADRAKWRDPTQFYQLLLEANIVAHSDGVRSTHEVAERALSQTRNELGLLGDKIPGAAAARAERLNPVEFLQFLSTFNASGAASEAAANALVKNYTSDTGVAPKPRTASVWEQVVATGERSSASPKNARAFVELHDAQNRLIYKGEVGREYNFENVDAFKVTIRNYHNNPLLPDLVVERGAGSQVSTSNWFAEAAPGGISGTQAEVAYSEARAADLIAHVTESGAPSEPGRKLVPDGMESRYGAVEVRSGSEHNKGAFTEVTLYREPAAAGAGADQNRANFRERLAATEGGILTHEQPTGRFSEASTISLEHTPLSERFPVSARGLRGVKTGLSVAFNFTGALDGVTTFVQGGALKDSAVAAAEGTLHMYADPTFWGIMGTQELIGAAAASEIPAVAAAGAYAGPVFSVAMTAKVAYDLTGISLEAAWGYEHATGMSDTRRRALAPLMAAPRAMLATSNAADTYGFFPYFVWKDDLSPEMLADPYAQNWIDRVDGTSPGGNDPLVMKERFEANLKQLIQEQQRDPFMFTSESGKELVEFAEELLNYPPSEIQQKIDFKREFVKITKGETDADLLKYLSYTERMGGGQGLNLPHSSWLNGQSVGGTLPNENDTEPLYINPELKEMDLGAFQLLSLEALNEQTTQPKDTNHALEQVVYSLVQLSAAGSSMTLPMEPEMAQQLEEMRDSDHHVGPTDKEWWGNYGPPPGGVQYPEQVFENAANGRYNSSQTSSPWDSGALDDGTYEGGVTINQPCVDPVTGEELQC